MLSKYFKIKTDSDEFKDNISTVFEELKEKRVLLYGAGEGFVKLNKKYDFKNKLNITGIADLKFEKNNKNLFKGFKKVSPKNIPNEDFDVILVTNEQSRKIIRYLKEEMRLVNDIKTLFTEKIKDEQINLNYLYKHKFDKTLPKLIKDMKDKKVVIYGAGTFFELMNKYFDFSELNIVAVADKKFEYHKEGETFLGKKVCSINEIEEIKPDYILLATKYYVNLIDKLMKKELHNIKIRPLVKKSFLELIKEVWY